MHIQHRDGKHHSFFYVEEDGDIVAEIVYAKGSNNTVIIEHIEVEEALQGHNVGFELVHRVVEYARTHGLKVSPVCPFAKAVFDKRADFKDVLV